MITTITLSEPKLLGELRQLLKRVEGWPDDAEVRATNTYLHVQIEE